eukprot:gene25501-biopygen2996
MVAFQRVYRDSIQAALSAWLPQTRIGTWELQTGAGRSGRVMQFLLRGSSPPVTRTRTVHLRVWFGLVWFGRRDADKAYFVPHTLRSRRWRPGGAGAGTEHTPTPRLLLADTFGGGGEASPRAP